MHTAPVAERSDTTEHARLAFFASIAAMTVMPIAVTGTNLAFGSIEADFDTSRSILSWALSGYSIAIAACTLIGGQLSDRLDTKRIFVLGLVGFAAASGIAAVAPHPGVLIGGRVLQGVAGALIVPSSLVLVTTQYPTARQPWVIGIWTAAFPIGSSVAPTVTAIIIDLASWRWVFGLSAVVAVAVAAMVSPVQTPRIVGEGGTRSQGATPDYLGIVFGTAAVGLAALGVVQGSAWGWTSLRVIGALTIAALLVPVFIRRSLGHPQPLMDLRLFSIPSYAIGSICNVFISAAGMSTWLVWPLFMAKVWDYDELELGLAITPTPVLAGSVALLSTRWTLHRGFRGQLIVGSIVLISANAWFLLLTEQPAYWTRMFPGLVLFGVAMGMCFAPINAAALIDVPADRYGQGNAGFNTGRFLAGAMGIAATVAALGEDDPLRPLAGYDRAFTLMVVLSALSAVLLIFAWPRSAPRPA